MKKSKLILITITLIFAACFMSGCGQNSEVKENEKQKVEETTIAGALAKQFKDEIKNEKDIEKVASSIAKNEKLGIQVDVSVLGNDDYISGFQSEIKGFDKVVAIRPMIGSIPFVAYIFEVENAEQFAKELKSNADLRWNICTEADDMEAVVVDHYVFFVMSPRNFD